MAHGRVQAPAHHDAHQPRGHRRARRGLGGVMEPLTTALYESKLIYYTPSFDDPVRTFCMNPYGEVSLENYGDVVTVNGHSYADFKTDRTNFAAPRQHRLHRAVRRPHRLRQEHRAAGQPARRGHHRAAPRRPARRATARTMDRIRRGTVAAHAARRDGRATSPSSLPYRHLTDILEMLEAMDELAPGVNGRDTLLYGVEVKFYSARPERRQRPADAGQKPVRHRRRRRHHARPHPGPRRPA